jgi:hypothetical protein
MLTLSIRQPYAELILRGDQHGGIWAKMLADGYGICAVPGWVQF